MKKKPSDFWSDQSKLGLLDHKHLRADLLSPSCDSAESFCFKLLILILDITPSCSILFWCLCLWEPCLFAIEHYMSYELTDLFNLNYFFTTHLLIGPTKLWNTYLLPRTRITFYTDFCKHWQTMWIMTVSILVYTTSSVYWLIHPLLRSEIV